MKHSISPDRAKLIITIDASERAELRHAADIQSDNAMYEFLEPLVCNSDLEWIDPVNTGDLTSAPMLGIYGQEEPYTKEMDGTPHIVTGPNLVQLVESRWAFMDYQVRSVLQDLRDYGTVTFIGGDL